MLTDALPRKSRSQFAESDRIKALELPQHRQLLMIAKSIESAMQAGVTGDVCRACAEFLAVASEFYKVPNCGVRVLAARPLRVRESWTSELFSDYNPETMLIRAWMRTAIRKEITSYGTFLSTLCHEFCHHLDFQDGTLAAFTNERPRSIIMPAIQPRKGLFGRQFQAVAGELTGHVQIAWARESEVSGAYRIYDDPLDLLNHLFPGWIKAPASGANSSNSKIFARLRAWFVVGS
jgi:hypothetical protein